LEKFVAFGTMQSAFMPIVSSLLSEAALVDVNPYRSPEPAAMVEPPIPQDNLHGVAPPTEPFQEPRMVVVWLLYGSVVVDVIVGVILAVQYFLLSALDRGEVVSSETLALTDQVLAPPFLLSAVFYFVTAIAWWAWQL
jgi:hypothetical protein